MHVVLEQKLSLLLVLCVTTDTRAPAELAPDSSERQRERHRLAQVVVPVFRGTSAPPVYESLRCKRIESLV